VPKSKGRKTQSREVCLRSPPRHAPRVHRLRTRHRGQPRENRSITNMGPIKDLKGVQRVMGCLAAMIRFISRLGEKGLPLYRLLKKTELGPPRPKKPSETLKHSLLMRPSSCPRCGRSPLDLRSRNHSGGQRCGRSRETRRRACAAHPEASLLHQRGAIRDQNPLPAILHAVILTRRKLRHYFESHPVTVVSSFPSERSSGAERPRVG
jgi:hypothetical protein